MYVEEGSQRYSGSSAGEREFQSALLLPSCSAE